MDNVDVSEILVSEKEIKAMVEHTASLINKDFGDEELIVVGILTGSYVFTADLVRHLTMPVIVDFMQVSSYQGQTSTGVLTIKKDLSFDITGKNVLIVEDIIDTGYTLKCLKEMLLKRNPKSLKICTAFDKPTRRTNTIEADYAGIVIPDKFIVGYGLDYDGEYRNLKDVCVVSMVGGN
ncbi:MAG: hypoxanthine phosphoribosyltransferase [Clostridia bacterium]|nr:hypoxanthine phosphoribosyltransferase [Clostridia bacterium]